MLPTAVLLECSDLTRDDLEDLKTFLEADDAVGDVTVGYLEMFEESEPNAPIEIHAAAAPFIFAVHILKDHWTTITGVAGAITTGVTTTARTASWVKKKIKAFNDSRDAKYDFKPLYDAEGNVHKLVKVPKK